MNLAVEKHVETHLVSYNITALQSSMTWDYYCVTSRLLTRPYDLVKNVDVCSKKRTGHMRSIAGACLGSKSPDMNPCRHYSGLRRIQSIF